MSEKLLTKTLNQKIVKQKLILSFKMLNYESVKTFSNKFIMKREPGYPRLTTTYTSSTYPGRMLVYETVMQNLRSVSVHQYIETDSVSIFKVRTDTYEPPRGKTNNVVSEQVRHKPTCTSTEAG